VTAVPYYFEEKQQPTSVAFKNNNKVENIRITIIILSIPSNFVFISYAFLIHQK